MAKVQIQICLERPNCFIFELNLCGIIKGELYKSSLLWYKWITTIKSVCTNNHSIVAEIAVSLARYCCKKYPFKMKYKNLLTICISKVKNVGKFLVSNYVFKNCIKTRGLKQNNLLPLCVRVGN